MMDMDDDEDSMTAPNSDRREDGGYDQDIFQNTPEVIPSDLHIESIASLLRHKMLEVKAKLYEEVQLQIKNLQSSLTRSEEQIRIKDGIIDIKQSRIQELELSLEKKNTKIKEQKLQLEENEKEILELRTQRKRKENKVQENSQRN
jgi:hypothetical protein